MSALPVSDEAPVRAAERSAAEPTHARTLAIPGVLAAETAAVGGLALAVRLPGLGHEPWGDELYHILAARDYLETGVFGINGGVYGRSAAYSEMVAGLYQVFGVSPLVARIPALIAAVLTIVVLFAWLRREGERLAAWVAALVLIFTPDLIEQAQYARFYPFQHLFLLLGAVTLSALIALPPGRPRRAWTLGIASLLSVAVSLYFQSLTVIGAAGLVLGGAVLAGPRIVSAVPRNRRALLAAGTLAAIALVAAAAWRLDAVQRILALATYTDLWGEGTRNEFRYYHWLLLEDYPAAWTLFPLLAVLALARQRRIATLALAVFGVGFVAHTLLAWKAARYVSYALPFFAAVVGLGAAHAVPFLRGAMERAIPRDAPGARWVRTLAWAAVIGFIVLTNNAFVDSARLLTRDNTVLHPGGPTPTLSWSLAEPVLEPLAADADAVVSTEDLEAIWFFDRLDYVLDRDHLLQGRAKPEFSVDGKIMVPMIGGTESLRRVVACHPTGLLVAMRWALQSYKMAPETAEFIRETLEPVPVPERSGLVAFRWDASSRAEAGECSGIPTAEVVQ